MDTTLVIVGPGRLGRSVAKILHSRGQDVQLIGRGQAIPKAPLTWLTVPDREVKAAALGVPVGGIVLHASGALEFDILRPHPQAGSLHPLMTFPGPEIGMPTGTTIPAAVAGDAAAVGAATALAKELGFTPFEVTGDRRLYHAAAVTAGNFATTLMLHAGAMLSGAGVPPEQARALLAPLAIASIKNVAQHGAQALTGPIARGDEQIVASHMEALTSMEPSLAALYADLCEHTRKLKR
jgi:predicted short-subunit dehydrogenase-like oxidoreductase (DUF2520 family)